MLVESGERLGWEGLSQLAVFSQIRGRPRVRHHGSCVIKKLRVPPKIVIAPQQRERIKPQQIQRQTFVAEHFDPLELAHWQWLGPNWPVPSVQRLCVLCGADQLDQLGGSRDQEGPSEDRGRDNDLAALMAGDQLIDVVTTPLNEIIVAHENIIRD